MIIGIIILVVVVAVVVTKSKEILEFFLGGTPIIRTVEPKKVESVPKLKTDSWSFARSIKYEEEPSELRFGYEDEGLHQEFEIRSSGHVFWKKNNEWESYHPNEPFYNCPEERLGKPVAVSYDSFRRGEWLHAPEFDMIVASSDRVFAKQKGLNVFFLSLPSPLYLHKKGANKNIVLPQSFFKLDPEIGDNQIEDLLTPHLKIEGDDETHLATNRFPLFRALFKFLTAFEFIKPLRDIFPNMVVQAHPYSWIKLDCRPPIGGIKVPAIYPAEESIVYQTPAPNPLIVFPEKVKKTIDFHKVLDIGVGLSHLNEQYDTVYGGQMDMINNPVNPLLRGLLSIVGVSVNSAEALYRLMNGPIQDVGGWVDGTCIYYVLVGLNYGNHDEIELINVDLPASLMEEIQTYNSYIRKAKALEQQLADGTNEIDISNTYFENAYAVLWVDEQLTFTNRWRALDIRDSLFPDISKCMVSSLSESIHGFTPSSFFNPSALGLLRSFSRMAVARQIVLINGYDSESKQHELYSIHFSWPTMDKTWRKRKLPAAGALSSDRTSELDFALVDTIGIREDMTIYMEGLRRGIKGRWTQKYLPATNRETPIINGKAAPFNHKWQFYSEEVFRLMNSRYRHFGVYQTVNSRCQFYRVKTGILKNPADLENNIWSTFQHDDDRLRAKITRRQLDYKKAAELIEGLIPGLPLMFFAALIIVGTSLTGLLTLNMTVTLIPLIVLIAVVLLTLGLLNVSNVSNCIPTLTKPSLYEDELRFTFRRTESNKVIMLYADKREDKNFRLDESRSNRILLKKLGGDEILFVDSISQVRSETQITRDGFVVTPAVKKATVTSILNSDNKLTGITITFTSARNSDEFDSHAAFMNWIGINVDRIKIGYFNTDGISKTIFDAKRSEIFAPIDSSNQFQAVIDTPNPFINFSEIQIRLNEESKIKLGLSIWFEGITGLANTAEETNFE